MFVLFQEVSSLRGGAGQPMVTPSIQPSLQPAHPVLPQMASQGKEALVGSVALNCISTKVIITVP